MSRSMTSSMQTGVAAKAKKVVRLVRIDFDGADGGSQFYTNCYKDLTYSGNTYIARNLISIGDAEENLTFQTPEVAIVLSGVTQANLATALTANYVDRDVTVYIGLLDSNEDLIADPIIGWLGQLDRPSFQEDPDNNTATLTWHAASQFLTFDKIAGVRTTNEDLELLFSGDLFFEFADQVEDNVPWGRP